MNPHRTAHKTAPQTEITNHSKRLADLAIRPLGNNIVKFLSHERKNDQKGHLQKNAGKGDYRGMNQLIKKLYWRSRRGAVVNESD